jgi:hypothetical protein
MIFLDILVQKPVSRKIPLTHLFFLGIESPRSTISRREELKKITAK